MLARSPIPTSSSNASPRSSLTTHHYAPSPRDSPSRVASRRQSTSFSAGLVGSPSQAQPKRGYVGVDASTQYSPMEPIDYRTGARIHASPAPGSQTQGVHDDSASVLRHASSPTNPTPKTSEQAKGDLLAGHLPVSPVKRRNVHGPERSNKTSSTMVTASALASPHSDSTPKRARPDVAPPKILPRRYELCALEDVVKLIAYMLGELIETNDELALKSGHLTRFHSRTSPGISVLDYLQRLAKHATLTPPLLLSMVFYIDKLCAMYHDFTINTLTVHRFLITAATVAAKGLSDAFWNNSTYARVGGIRVTELKLLELEFLSRVDWKIIPNPEVLVAYYQGLIDRCPGYVLEPEEEVSAPATIPADAVVGVETDETDLSDPGENEGDVDIPDVEDDEASEESGAYSA